MARICVSVADGRPVEGADLVELRLDRIPGAAPAIPKGTQAIVTCRPQWEGGAFAGPEEKRRAILEEAARAGAWAVDIELEAKWRPTLPAGVRRIVSSHDFSGTPADLRGLAERMLAEKADWVKIAATPHTPAELAALLRIQDSLGGRGVVVPMGELAAPARVLAARHGAPWTYASAPGGEPTAPGQWSADDLRGLFRFESIGSGTRAFCVAGDPVAHSRSPRLFNALFRIASLDAVYLPARIQAGSLFPMLEALGIEGASVTLPLKEEAWRGCRADAHAERAGAVNTLARRGGAWEGTNTDARGFLGSLEAGLGRRAAGLRVVVLGAGGTARAVLSALASGNDLMIASRTRERAEVLATEFGARAIALEKLGKEGWDVLVNATPAGMEPDVEGMAVDAAIFRPGAAVYDCVYTPAETRLLREAKARGCVAIPGSGMFFHQAMLQAEYWLGGNVRDAFSRAERETRMEK